MSEMFGGIGTDNVITKKFFHEESSFYIAYLAAKSPKFLGNYNIPAGYLVGNGFSFNEEEAKIKALGEFIERYCAEVSVHEKEIYRYSIKELVKKSLAFVHPNTLRPYKNCSKYPEIQDDEVISYVKGYEALDKKEILIPALAAFLPFKPINLETTFFSPSATGLSAYTNQEQAELSALLEVQERSDLMASWRIKNLKIQKLLTNDLPDHITKFLYYNNFKLRLFVINQTVLAMLCHINDTGLTIGSKSGVINIITILAAINEAIALQITMLNKRVRFNAIPKNSLEHVMYAYFNSEIFIEFYEKKVDAQLSFISENQINKNIFFVDLSTKKAKESGWYCARCINIEAFSKENNAYYPHLKNFFEHGFTEAELNLLPHPFG